MVKRKMPMNSNPKYRTVWRKDKYHAARSFAWFAQKKYLGFLWLYLSGTPHWREDEAREEIEDHVRLLHLRKKFKTENQPHYYSETGRPL